MAKWSPGVMPCVLSRPHGCCPSQSYDARDTDRRRRSPEEPPVVAAVADRSDVLRPHGRGFHARRLVPAVADRLDGGVERLGADRRLPDGRHDRVVRHAEVAVEDLVERVALADIRAAPGAQGMLLLRGGVSLLVNLVEQVLREALRRGRATKVHEPSPLSVYLLS